MLHKILGLAVILFSIIACTHPDQEQFTKTHWVVTQVNDSIVSTSVGLYFETSEEMSFRQSANSCSGKYSLNGKNLSIKLKYCTEMCCDDKLSGLVEDLISPEVEYRIEGEQLFLTHTNGKLVLKRQVD